jgi:hypothetical protein
MEDTRLWAVFRLRGFQDPCQTVDNKLAVEDKAIRTERIQPRVLSGLHPNQKQ